VCPWSQNSSRYARAEILPAEKLVSSKIDYLTMTALPRRPGKKHNAAGETAVEKLLRGKVPNQTFPPSLEIAQRTRDSHFPAAAATAGLRLISNVSTIDPRVTF